MPPFRHTAGFSATGTLDRKAFGIDAWEGLIGDTVELRIEAEAVRRRAPQADGAGREVAEPEAADPEVAEPEGAEPEVAEPEVAPVPAPVIEPQPASEPTPPT
jgi:hypothetical protein